MIRRLWDCHWVRRRLPLLTLGDLPPDQRRRAERHLAGCAACRQGQAAWARSLEPLARAAAQPPPEPAGRSLWPVVRTRLAASGGASLRAPRLSAAAPWAPVGILAAACVVVAILGTTPPPGPAGTAAGPPETILPATPRPIAADVSGQLPWRTVGFDLSGGSIAPPESGPLDR